MIKIIKSYFRDKKMNIIYVMLIVLLLIVLYSFLGIKRYCIYNINEVLGSLEENRGYIVETTDDKIVNSIKSKYNIRKPEKNYSDGSIINYYIVLDNYKDTDSFLKYTHGKNINVYLKNSTKKYEIEILNKNVSTFELIKNISIILFFFILFFLFKNIFLNEIKNIAILKILGYRNIIIGVILFFRYLLLGIISLILAIILFFLISFCLFIIQNNLKEYLFAINYFEYLEFDIKIFFLMLILILYNCFKIKKVNIFESLKN